MAQYSPKTLAKTLSYIAWHAPGEYGLFWDSDGTMPWKELYWALQQDASLRFVREAHMREMAYLGLDLPFYLDGSLLRLQENTAVPEYPVTTPAERLYYACPRKRYPFVLMHGLSSPGNRPFLALAADKNLALQLGRRRDADPIMVEVQAKKASLEGVAFRLVAPSLYLVESVAAAYLICPPIRESEMERLAARKKKERPSAPSESTLQPGSFYLDSAKLFEPEHEKGHETHAKRKGRGKKGSDWKRDSRNLRNKRSI